MTEQMNVPKLRFRDFSEGFSVTPLSEIISKLESGVSVNSEDVPPKSNEYGILKTSAIYAGNFIPEQAKLITDESELQRAKLNPKKDSIIISRMNTPALVGESGYVSKDYPNLFIPDRLWQATISTKYSARWLSYLLTSPRTRFIISSKGTGTSNSMKNISKPSFLSINVATPALPEQQKIASFLSKVDEKVALLTEKKDKLTEYKKGVMQQLFNGKWQEQDGKLVFVPPTLRFKADDGSEFPDWEEKMLGDVLIKYRLGGNYQNSEVRTQFPLIKMGNLGRGNINLNKVEYILEGEAIDSQDRIQEGDLFFNTRNTLELVGKVAIWKNELSEAYYNSNLMRLEFDNNYFMNYCLNSFKGVKGLRRFATGTTSVAAIYTRDLLKLKLSIPSLEEQTKISDFLSVVDQKIDLTNSELEKAKEWKKGLLQQMFV